jgi:hypothetical protein
MSFEGGAAQGGQGLVGRFGGRAGHLVVHDLGRSRQRGILVDSTSHLIHGDCAVVRGTGRSKWQASLSRLRAGLDLLRCLG